MNCIVSKSFQWRGETWRTGQRIQLGEAELADPFVKRHVRAASDGERPPERPYLGNGVEKPKEEPPARAANAAKDGMSAQEMRAALAKMGVQCPPNATKDDLAALLAQAKEAVAGSPENPNAPELGI